MSKVNKSPIGGGQVRARAVPSGAAIHTPAWVRLQVPVLGGLLALLGTWYAIDGDPGTITRFQPYVGMVTSTALVAVTFSLLRVSGLGEATRRAWRTMAAAFTVFWVNAVAVLAARLVPGLDAGPIGEIAILIGFSLLVLALFRFPSAPKNRLRQARFAFDSATVFAAVGLFVWHFSVAPLLFSDAISVWVAVLILAVVGFISVLVVATTLLLLRERAPAARGALIRLVAANAAVFVLLLVAVVRYTGEPAEPQWWSTMLGWSATLLWMSAAVRQRDAAHEPHPETGPGDTSSTHALPYTLVALVFGFLLFEGLGLGSMQLRGLMVGAAVVGGSVLVRQGLLLRENANLQVRLREQAMRDPLTGLLNRRAWDDAAQRELARAERYGLPLSLIVFDLDNFKVINDGSGHAAGDEVLVATGRVLDDLLRASDVSGRVGGDEFMVLLPDTPLADAAVVAGNLCGRARAISVEGDGGPLPITISAGVAGVPPAGSLRELLASADAAMYEAKRAGRDQVKIADAIRWAGPEEAAHEHPSEDR